MRKGLLRLRVSISYRILSIKCNLFIQHQGFLGQAKMYEKAVEMPGIDPGTSRMLSERSTI